MRKPGYLLLTAMGVLSFAFLAGCGGGGNGFGAPSNPLVIMGSTLPAVQSGDNVDFEIPLGGGCSGSGPYVVEVIAGALPAGVGTDQAAGRHHLTGVLLEDGLFDFTVKITDTSCTPFLTAIQVYEWNVSQGPVQIVGAEPGLIPVASYDDPLKWAGIDALEKTVYGSFVAYKLVVAGGIPPYEISIDDDPADPDDGALPTGVSIPTASVSFTGQPIEVGPGGKPFRLTFRVTDSIGNTSTRKLQWKIDTPPIIIANATLADGQAGRNFADSFQIVDGVPPFRFELLDDFPTVSNEDIVYGAPNAPTFPSATGFTVEPVNGGASNMLFDGSPKAYPADGDAGPQLGYAGYGPFPSEGVALNVDTGTLSGLPRRAGTFTLHVHVCSTLVPNERGQHAFRTYTHAIAPSEPPTSGNPAFDLTPAFTVEGAFLPGPNDASIAEFEAGSPNYNPDTGDPGLQLTAVGGVPADGSTDAPHAHQKLAAPGEVPGTYKWESDWDVAAGGLQAPPAGITFDPSGVVDVTAAGAQVRVAREYVEFYVKDYQLPTVLENSAVQRVAYSVGPDSVIISQSSASLSSTYTYYGDGNRHAWDDHTQRIKKFKATASASIASLDATDMASTHVMPAAAALGASSNPLGDLLSANNLDLMRGVVNATGWWDDLHTLNPRGAKHGSHADFNYDKRDYPQQGGYYYANNGYGYGNWQPNVTCIELPDAENVPGGHNPAGGVYTDGGRLYHFESSTHYGMFIIREDGRIYVPYAAKKSTTREGFGDGCSEVLGAPPHNSAFRVVHMTVSPDGRFGAMKVMTDSQNMYENAATTKIVLVSLSGEKVFGGSTYKVVDSGSSSTGSGNRIQYAASLALTNDQLYFLIGTQSPPNGTSTSSSYMYYEAWRGHFIMRYTLLSGASSAAKLTSASGDSAWTQDQSSTTTMQTVYQFHGPNYVSTSTGPHLRESSTSYGYRPYHRYWWECGMNMNERNLAPGPFRVSRDGSTVAFFAALDYTNYYGYDVYSNYCWIDRGAGAVRVTSTRRRHLMGSSRGYTLFKGPEEYGSSAWGRYAGPTPGVEISDDGSQVAFVYNTSGYFYGSDAYSYCEQKNYRDDILLTRTTNGWASFTEKEVTKNTFNGVQGTTSSSYVKWRFGGLAFTALNDGLAFWGGAGGYYGSQTSSSYQQSYALVGQYYIYNVSDTDKVTVMCGTSEGGRSSAGTVYTSSAKFSGSTSSGINYTKFGAVHPYGGFLSKNREFMYVVNYGASSSSEATAGKLIGFNIHSAGTGSFAGKTNGRAFIPASWPGHRGFMGGGYPVYPAYYRDYYGQYADEQHGKSMQVMSKDTGWVFWGANSATYGPYNPSSSNAGGTPHPLYYYGTYMYGGLKIMGFNADTGGKVSELQPSGMAASSDTASSPYEGLNYIEVTRDGSKLIFVTSYGDSNYYRKHQERVNYVTNIDFSSGSLHGAFNASADAGRLQASNGRAGEALGYSVASDTAYYAFKQGASNENAMEIVKAKWNAASKSWDVMPQAVPTGRIHVLFAAR